MQNDSTNFIRDRRTALKLTQHELANAMEVSIKTIQNWELETHAPAMRFAPRLADVLKMKLDGVVREIGRISLRIHASAAA